MAGPYEDEDVVLDDVELNHSLDAKFRPSTQQSTFLDKHVAGLVRGACTGEAETATWPERIVIRPRFRVHIESLGPMAYAKRVKLHFINPGRLVENGYIARFHGRFREECLNERWFCE